MVVSYHPCFEADDNRLCAGRRPDDEDRAAMQAAAAVILPQGCRAELYHLARRSCRQVFPNYDARFACPGKIGQIGLFRDTGVRYPPTQTCARQADFDEDRLPGDFPLVFKFDWGGEGETVFVADDRAGLGQLLQRALRLESGGQSGFLVQAYVPGGHRCLRVVVIGRRLVSYWRVIEPGRGRIANRARGARIEAAEPGDLRDRAEAAVSAFCRQTGINLAGFDLLFSAREKVPVPQFLEINFFFGRRGLGGSQRYYDLLLAEIRGWLARRGLVPAGGTADTV